MWKTSLIAAAFALMAATAQAADMTFLIGGAMSEPFKVVGADFAKKTGDKIDYTFDTTGALQMKLRGGEKADIVLLSAAGLDAMEKEHLVQPGTRVDLARALIGVSVKRGAKAPDLSTPDAFKAALVNARSVAYVDPAAGGTSGIYLSGLLKRMGIADAVSKKTVFGKQGSEVAEAVASGKAEIGITFISEMLPNKGVAIASPLPDPIQSPTVYSAAIAAMSPNPVQARAFLAAMTSAEGASAIKNAGLEPIKR